jgi:hypothetical protein
MAAGDDFGVGVTARVQWRDPFGRFAMQLREAGDESAYDLAKDGAKLSAAYAPTKTRRLVRAIKAVKGLTGQARWVVEGDPKLLRYAAAQETGARPHIIQSHDGGPLANKEEKFFARSGRVRHPGNPAVHFMQRARVEIARKAVVTVRKNIRERTKR